MVLSSLYFLSILHQTTTCRKIFPWSSRCISYQFYIKPQLDCLVRHDFIVVFPINSTSNHNCLTLQTVTTMLYFLSILHQTTTHALLIHFKFRCISYQFYIKPQLVVCQIIIIKVVFPINSTSNHNLLTCCAMSSCVVFPINSTSNHNHEVVYNTTNDVVFPINSTSNHNLPIY